MKVCEKHDTDMNKWSELPPLKITRFWSGSVLLKSKRVFCFCGGKGDEEWINSIESLHIDKEHE